MRGAVLGPEAAAPGGRRRPGKLEGWKAEIPGPAGISAGRNATWRARGPRAGADLGRHTKWGDNALVTPPQRGYDGVTWSSWRGFELVEIAAQRNLQYHSGRKNRGRGQAFSKISLELRVGARSARGRALLPWLSKRRRSAAPVLHLSGKRGGGTSALPTARSCIICRIIS